MMNTAILPSETLARKAQRILTANGYPANLSVLLIRKKAAVSD